VRNPSKPTAEEEGMLSLKFLITQEALKNKFSIKMANTMIHMNWIFSVAIYFYSLDK